MGIECGTGKGPMDKNTVMLDFNKHYTHLIEVYAQERNVVFKTTGKINLRQAARELVRLGILYYFKIPPSMPDDVSQSISNL